jgi:uncharacterized SAM-dependent methyltransferase
VSYFAADAYARWADAGDRRAARAALLAESSYKYTLEEFAQLAASAGFNVERVWTDPRNLFSVQYLKVM